MASNQPAGPTPPDERSAFDVFLGTEFPSVTADEVVEELVVRKEHLAPTGAVHGGVYCALVESSASRGAVAWASERGDRLPFGVENMTSFVRPVREGGRLRARATPVSRGRTSQLWEVKIEDDEGRVVAVGRVRFVSQGG